ncbi:DUF2059 domain-containing protein [Lentilitoribacter sp. Alg239-R112]|uniref:DUF2059 domain-containing protein n=1 Tax=Lentilitoribacter sp. Alg239-R112 TaxID=2305987 RepID=UPI0013A6A9BA|nr:DUF2059 domain-containing protein [Lentilitoribacter sp. Alg239-R112]
MSIQRQFRKIAFGTGLILALSPINSTFAQDISADHLKVARQAIGALKVTASFDDILPATSERLKASLIQANPNFSDEISLTVDEEAIKIAGRRSALEEEAAMIYAKKFSLAELTEIAAFYNTEAGKKLLQSAPSAGRELLRAAEIWAGGISRDLSAAANVALKEKLTKAADVKPETPAEGDAAPKAE